MGWRRLWQTGERPSFLFMLRARWIGESVDGLLPVAQVGGTLVKVRLLAQQGFPGAMSGASVIAELTLAVFTLIIFSFMGVGLLLRLGGHELVSAVLIGLTVVGLLIGSFFILQQKGLFVWITGVLERLVRNRDWQKLAGGAAELDQAILKIYRDPRTLLSSSSWILLGWVMGAGEVWLAMYFLGAPVSLSDALLLESLGQAVRFAAFMIPGAFGVQEGCYLVLGGLLGLSPQLALALSLTKRVRVLLFGIPGLISWQITEGRRLFAERGETA
jgi:putative membrane protein